MALPLIGGAVGAVAGALLPKVAPRTIGKFVGPKVGAVLGAGTGVETSRLVVDPVLEGLDGAFVLDDRFELEMDGLIEGERSRRQGEKVMRRRLRRLGQLQAENERRLATMLPDVYNEVATGRRLPRGAIVIGGSKRQDLIDQLTRRMAFGEV